MISPSFGKVTVQTSDNKKKSKFNLSHDNNTSFDWGSVQPVLSQLMLPDSSINVNMEQLTRLAPMPVPTFGRVKMKNTVHFVSIKDIFPNFEYFLAKKPVARPQGRTVLSFVPNTLPHINNTLLTAFALAGAKFNLYYSAPADVPADKGKWYCASGSAPTLNNVRNLARYLFGYPNSGPLIGNPNTVISDLGYTGYAVSVWKFTKGSGAKGLIGGDFQDFFYVPTITTLDTELIDSGSGVANGYTHSFLRTAWTDLNGTQHVDDPVSFDGSDLIWESEITEASRQAGSGSVWEGFNTSGFDGRKVRITIQLSSFGKRLRKVLIGLGYNFSLNDDSEVSILPLLAYYKAYWDTYAPERTQNFYTTSAWRLIQLLSDGNAQCDITQFIASDDIGFAMRTEFKRFIFDLGTLFATDRMDAISACTEKMILDTGAYSADVYYQIRNVMKDYYKNVADSTFASNDMEIANRSLEDVGTTFPVLVQGNSSYAMLTQPQLDALKKAYIYVNKYSVAGMNIAEILRMNGEGKYVEECQGKFVASSEDAIKISDVVATSGTDANKLGQYGGRGLGASADQFSFSTDRHGYLIMLSCIVPQSGYVNSPDMTNEVIDRNNFFEEIYDGMNYEALVKKQLAGSKQIQKHEDSSCNDTFGYLPTFSNWKFKFNIANGDFSLFSRRTATRPYTLDKYIPVDDVNVVDLGEDSDGTKIVLTTEKFSYSDLPNAGEDYRYVAKMPWNGDYNRMFTAEDDGLEWQVMSNASNSNGYLYNSFEYDNFQTHFIFNVQYWSPMKAIEDSYSTYDEEDVASRGGISRS